MVFVSNARDREGKVKMPKKSLLARITKYDFDSQISNKV